MKARLILAVLLGLMLSSCGQDDLKNVTTVSAKKVALTKDRSYEVEIIYSDSAIVKGKGFAPVLDKVTPATGGAYSEMPEGVKIEFYDAYLQVTSSITSNYAINKEAERITIFKKNVRVVNDQMTFTTEELTWDENTATYFSPSGTVTTKDGTVIAGASFSAPQDLSTYKIVKASGSGYVKENIVP